LSIVLVLTRTGTE